MVKMFHARRTPDAAQKKQMTDSSTVIADIMLKHLSPQNLSEEKDKTYTYYGLMLGLINMLLVDGKDPCCISRLPPNYANRAYKYPSHRSASGSI